MIGFLMGTLLTMCFICATGIVMYSFYHECDLIKARILPKYTYLVPRFVDDIADNIPGMRGVFISCVFSASLSAVSASLHAVSGIIYTEYIRPLRLFAHTDANAILSMRILIFILGSIGTLGTVFYENLQSIIHAMHTIASISVGAKFGVFTIGMVYPWVNQKVFFYHIIICRSMKSSTMHLNLPNKLGCSKWNFNQCDWRCNNFFEY